MIHDRIYLACPYTHPSEEVRLQRFIAVTQTAARLTAQGFQVYSPITMGHVLGMVELMPSDWGFWARHCLSFVERWATVVYVLQLDGWQESLGVGMEIKAAKRMDIPVIGVLPVPDNFKGDASCLQLAHTVAA